MYPAAQDWVVRSEGAYSVLISQPSSILINPKARVNSQEALLTTAVKQGFQIDTGGAAIAIAILEQEQW